MLGLDVECDEFKFHRFRQPWPATWRKNNDDCLITVVVLFVTFHNKPHKTENQTRFGFWVIFVPSTCREPEFLFGGRNSSSFFDHNSHFFFQRTSNGNLPKAWRWVGLAKTSTSLVFTLVVSVQRFTFKMENLDVVVGEKTSGFDQLTTSSTCSVHRFSSNQIKRLLRS